MPPAVSRRALLAAALLPALARPAAAQAGLGLAERRAIAAYREQIFPGLLTQMRAATGTDLDVDVAWDRIAKPGEAAAYGEPGYWTNIYFTPLITALKSVTADQIGRDALKAKLRRIAVTCDEATAPASNYPNGLRFADGTLTINWRPYTNTDAVAERAAALQKVLEDNL